VLLCCCCGVEEETINFEAIAVICCLLIVIRQRIKFLNFFVVDSILLAGMRVVAFVVGSSTRSFFLLVLFVLLFRVSEQLGKLSS